ncbi:MAG: phosphonate metabolism transcriptional regulator PhnF [Alphaproteobacteria bacterium]|nr:phosphonate metabolism transcriptional regulator PhnF [Alphaproteobacteria bacterium]MBU1550219.1 phosphonate metabolism transcriptional regulator PhnF [Alphaproteobacteria bacterium]MBU2337860.1 phosphonate metabolism transcriptional regulator PhnF [Alphaproteobacteria bacterium]MBU2387840.1 phosphonate metabolism transcriptional regulator PhnF [Alphaproteobacteria bacterium]
MVGQASVQRQSGVALWRQIADRIRASIASGEYDATGRVPPEIILAAQFGVNRHTVRSALAALAQEGIVKAVQGIGTMIERKERLNFPISRRTRFNEGIGAQARETEGLLLASAEEPASDDLARRLQLGAGAAVIRLETLRKADGRPVSRATAWFPAERFAGIEEAYRASGSITAAFRVLGLSDYVRVSTEITASHADGAEMDELGLSAGAIVLVTHSLNADPDGIPVQYAVSRFPADRVQFTIEN